MNTAASLVMQYGTRHLSGLEKDELAEINRAGNKDNGMSNRIDDAQCRGVDDTAPLCDITSMEISESKGENRRRTEVSESKERDIRNKMTSGGNYARGLSSEERESSFESLCKTLSGIEQPSKYVKVSEIPSTTVCMSDQSQKIVSADALLPGQRVIVMDTALSYRLQQGKPDHLSERNAIVGVVAEHSVDGKVVRVLTLDQQTGLSYTINIMPAHQDMYAISELAGRSITELEHIHAAVLSTEQALAKMYVRLSIVSLTQCCFDDSCRQSLDGSSNYFENSPVQSGSSKIMKGLHVGLRQYREMAHLLFDADSQMGNATNIASKLYLCFLKLSAASENIFTRGASLFPHVVDAPVTNFLRNKLKKLLTIEVQREHYQYRAESKLKGDNSGETKNLDRNIPISKILIDECIENLKDSTTPGPGTNASTRDSLHPVFPSCDYTDTVFLRGAKMLWVLFDPRCQTTHGATLSFYPQQDPRCQGSPIAQFSGDSSQFMPFVVPGGKVHFRFQSNRRIMEDEDSDVWGCGWGYRFQVRPLRGLSWMCELQTMNPSLEWACWLLEFLLNDVADLGSGIVHNKVSEI